MFERPTVRLPVACSISVFVSGVAVSERDFYVCKCTHESGIIIVWGKVSNSLEIVVPTYVVLCNM